jgi:hypothetical protein
MAASLCPSADDAMDVSRPVPLEGGTVSRHPFALFQLVPASFVSQIAAGCVDDSRRWVTPQAATVPPVADEVRGTVLPAIVANCLQVSEASATFCAVCDLGYSQT